MPLVQVGGLPEKGRQNARHRLFVEGSGAGSMDVEALKILLPMLDIRPMGPAFHLQSVAAALHPYHPDDYFLIDRDHHDDQTVEKSWSNFPDATQSNLLIWRKREIENYFLDPPFLQLSQYIKDSYKGPMGGAELERQIAASAEARLYLDVANKVIVTIRERQKGRWIQTFKNPSEFPNARTARQKLLARPEFQERVEEIGRTLRDHEIGDLFDQYLQEMSGSQRSLTFAAGTWRDHMSGKEILRQIINNCFEVKNAQGKLLQGDKKYIEVIKDLMRQGQRAPDKLPADFQELRRLITTRIGL
ncbi:MAG: hypothetical protein HQL66_07490 [Magnetococcales bacterium]|nr:hypothetical protein [Magnetococcales bacterium]